MTDILIKGAACVVTMDAGRRELAGADVLMRGGVIAAVGPGLVAPLAEVVQAAGCVVTPGLVNTHHHLYQTLTRAVPGRPGCAVVRLAENAVSDLGRLRAGRDVRLGCRLVWPNWRCRAAR
jgi:cytosine/adenosine deaminase-related metal-dependent hydrolase